MDVTMHIMPYCVYREYRVVQKKAGGRSRRFEPGALAWKATIILAPRLQIYTMGIEVSQQLRSIHETVQTPVQTAGPN